MSTKTLVWIGVIVGSVIGQFLPTIFGVSIFSAWSILTSGIGAILGILLAIKLSEHLS